MDRLFLRRAADLNEELTLESAIALFHRDVGKVFRFVSPFSFILFILLTYRPHYFIHLFDEFSTADGVMTFGGFRSLWRHLSDYRYLLPKSSPK